jgi:hypothetical protein
MSAFDQVDVDPIHHIQQILLSSTKPSNKCITKLCTTLVDYKHSEQFDLSFGCGYRNFQMLLSCLVNASPSDVPPFLNEKLQAYFGSKRVPDVYEIQDLIEMAWSDGFDKVQLVHSHSYEFLLKIKLNKIREERRSLIGN